MLPAVSGTRSILVSRARRFLITWLGNEGLQIEPSGSGDENGHGEGENKFAHAQAFAKMVLDLELRLRQT